MCGKMKTAGKRSVFFCFDNLNQLILRQVLFRLFGETVPRIIPRVVRVYARARTAACSFFVSNVQFTGFSSSTNAFNSRGAGKGHPSEGGGRGSLMTNS